MILKNNDKTDKFLNHIWNEFSLDEIKILSKKIKNKASIKIEENLICNELRSLLKNYKKISGKGHWDCLNETNEDIIIFIKENKKSFIIKKNDIHVLNVNNDTFAKNIQIKYKITNEKKKELILLVFNELFNTSCVEYSDNLQPWFFRNTTHI